MDADELERRLINQPLETDALLIRPVNYRPRDPLFADVGSSCTSSQAEALDVFVHGETTTSHSYSSYDRFQIALFMVTSALMNPFIAHLAPNGQFPFLWSNFYCMLAIIASITFALQTKKPLKDVPAKMFLYCFLGSLCYTTGYILFPLGIALSSVGIGSALWFSLILWNALFGAIIRRTIPDFKIICNLVSTLFIIIGFAYESCMNSKDVSTTGILLCVIAMIPCSFASVITGYIGREYIDVDPHKRHFCMFFSQIFAAFVIIPFESLLVKGNLSVGHFIPGSHFTLECWGYLLFAIFQLYASNSVNFMDVSTYTTTAYSSNLFATIIAGAQTYFVGFDVLGFILTIGIFANAVAVQLNEVSQKFEMKVHKIQDLLASGNMSMISKLIKEVSKSAENERAMSVAQSSSEQRAMSVAQAFHFNNGMRPSRSDTDLLLTNLARNSFAT